jgi:hypothetical protein
MVIGSNPAKRDAKYVAMQSIYEGLKWEAHRLTGLNDADACLFFFSYNRLLSLPFAFQLRIKGRNGCFYLTQEEFTEQFDMSGFGVDVILDEVRTTRQKLFCANGYGIGRCVGV